MQALDVLSRQPNIPPPSDLDGPVPESQFFEFDTTNLFLLGSPAGFFLLLERGSLTPRKGREKPGAEAAVSLLVVLATVLPSFQGLRSPHHHVPAHWRSSLHTNSRLSLCPCHCHDMQLTVSSVHGATYPSGLLAFVQYTTKLELHRTRLRKTWYVRRACLAAWQSTTSTMSWPKKTL